MSYLSLLRSSPEEQPQPLPQRPIQNEQRSGELLDEQTSRALYLLHLAGCRIIAAGGKHVIGVWQDLDGAEIRSAIARVGMQDSAVVYLEGDVPLRFKVRTCPDRTAGESFIAWMQRAEQQRRKREEKQ